jgi:hypothetical protein
MQNTRSQTAQNMQDTRADTVNNYYGGGSCYNCWDNGDAAAGFVAGAIVGGAVAAASQPTTTVVTTTAPAAAPPATVPPPCNVAPIPVSGVPYYKCGATWYTAGYAANGVVYMPVPPPPGY